MRNKINQFDSSLFPIPKFEILLRLSALVVQQQQQQSYNYKHNKDETKESI